MLGQLKHLDLVKDEEEIKKNASALLVHIFDCHDNCGDWYYKRKAMIQTYIRAYINMYRKIAHIIVQQNVPIDWKHKMYKYNHIHVRTYICTGQRLKNISIRTRTEKSTKNFQ